MRLEEYGCKNLINDLLEYGHSANNDVQVTDDESFEIFGYAISTLNGKIEEIRREVELLKSRQGD